MKEMDNPHFVEPDIITEMWITVQFRIATISRSSSLNIAPKDVDDTVLNLLRNFDEVHVFATACRAFDLKVIPIILIKSLKTFDEQEVDSEPWVDREFLRLVRDWTLQIGPRQLEFPPNIPECESPGQYLTSCHSPWTCIPQGLSLCNFDKLSDAPSDIVQEPRNPTYDRIPYSLKNSFSSSIFSRMRTSLSLLASASKRRSPFPLTIEYY